MPDFETPTIGQNDTSNLQYHDYTSVYGGNINDIKDGMTLNSGDPELGTITVTPSDDMVWNAINGQTQGMVQKTYDNLKEQFGKDADIQIQVSATVDENGDITYKIAYNVTPGANSGNNNTPNNTPNNDGDNNKGNNNKGNSENNTGNTNTNKTGEGNNSTNNTSDGTNGSPKNSGNNPTNNSGSNGGETDGNKGNGTTDGKTNGTPPPASEEDDPIIDGGVLSEITVTPETNPGDYPPLKEKDPDFSQDIPASAKTLPTGAGQSWADGAAAYYTEHYSDGNGGIDTDALTKAWVSNGGTATTYTNNGDGTWSQSNWSSSSSGEDWSWTGFDVFSVGGGWNDPWGTMSFYGSGGGMGGGDLADPDGNPYANPFDKKNKSVMMQTDDRL